MKFLFKKGLKIDLLILKIFSLPFVPKIFVNILNDFGVIALPLRESGF
jgi:hypothetical protein